MCAEPVLSQVFQYIDILARNWRNFGRRALGLSDTSNYVNKNSLESQSATVIRLYKRHSRIFVRILPWVTIRLIQVVSDPNACLQPD